MGDSATRTAIEAVWQLERTRLIAGLVRIVRDVGLAEDLAQDAVVAALAQWPVSGIPDNPAAWLMTTAKRRGVDFFRSSARQRDAHADAANRQDPPAEPGAGLDHVEDDVLRLMFICCHPALTAEAQTTLTLRLVAGLSAREIARAYLTTESTIAQRISRAKRTLSQIGAAIEEPSGPERRERLTAVLAVVYLLFNEGYAATEGEDWMRPTLCEEAARLARILTALLPNDAETHALAALVELQASRLGARADADGRPILLEQQDRARWDGGRIRRGLDELQRADELAAEPGALHLQAAIAACHATAASFDRTDWPRIAQLYEQLARVTRSSVVEVNRAVALGRAYGAEAGLELIDQLVDRPELGGYHLLPTVRGDLLAQLGRDDEAEAEFARAASLARNAQERQLLRARAGLHETG